VGINSAIASQTGFYSGYGFAIPITLAKQVMDDLIQHGEVRRAVIGVAINEVTPEDAAVAGLSEIAGVKVGGFSGEDSPAMKAGIEPGDVIVKADGKSVDRVSALQRVIRAKKPGDVVPVEVMRYGTKKNFQIRLGAAPKDNGVVADAGAAPAAGTSVSNARLGLSVEALSSEMVQGLRIPEAYRGARVSEIEAGGPAEGRLAVGDVIAEVLPAKKKISTPSDVYQALEGIKGGAYVSFLIYRPVRGGTGSTTVVNLRVRDGK